MTELLMAIGTLAGLVAAFFGYRTLDRRATVKAQIAKQETTNALATQAALAARAATDRKMGGAAPDAVAAELRRNLRP